MDALERFAELEEVLRQAMDSRQAKTWTTLPASIVSFDPGEVTAVVQPALQATVQSKDGTVAAVNLPLLIHVPVVFPRGGGVTLTFPIAEGDECVVHFSARCIDGWWQSGGVQLPMDTRMHDLSDAFCVVGPQSQVKKITGISTTAAQLRTDDGEAYLSIDPSDHAVAVSTPGNVAVVAGGNLSANVTGNVDATVGGHLNAGAASVQVTAPHIRLVGIVDVVGALNVSGLASLNGGFGALPVAGGGASTINSAVNVTGTATLGHIVQGGKSIDATHEHPNGGGGSPTGGVI